MFLRILKIKKLLVGENHLEVVLTLGQLACLYLHLEKFQEVEVLFFK